jgi:hypothetical protein
MLEMLLVWWDVRALWGLWCFGVCTNIIDIQ